MLDNSNVKYILDIKDKVFETAEIGGNCVFVSSRKLDSEESRVLILQDISDLNNPKYEILNQKRFNIAPDYKFYIDSESFDVFNKIENAGNRLETLCNFYNGIKTGDNKKFIKNSKEDNFDELAIRGRDIQRYFISQPSVFVHFDKKELWSNTNEVNLRKIPKILVRQTGDSIICALDNKGLLHMDTTHGLFDFKVDIHYLIGILNSKLISYWHRAYTSEKGRAFAEVKIANIKKIPIKLPENQEIIRIVKTIMSMPSDDVNEYEKLDTKINELVMDLYGLTEEEKEIIRNS